MPVTGRTASSIGVASPQKNEPQPVTDVRVRSKREPADNLHRGSNCCARARTLTHDTHVHSRCGGEGQRQVPVMARASLQLDLALRENQQ